MYLPGLNALRKKQMHGRQDSVRRSAEIHLNGFPHDGILHMKWMLSQYSSKLAKEESLAVQVEIASAIATNVGSERHYTLVVNIMFINMHVLTIVQ